MSSMPASTMRLVGHDADDVAVQAREADDDVLRPELVHFEEATVVDDAGDHLSDERLKDR